MVQVSRKSLLTAVISPNGAVSKVVVQEVTMEPGAKAPPHLHPCPTMGVVTEGAISFQTEGQPVSCLQTGDAFYEPPNVRVYKFDNDGNVPAKFVVFYLLGQYETDTVHILKT
ncbi:MAG: cupin domain-containing protein [Candidatus Omnitrophica bacterium]|nr:cupin domain-containing protein [Candidatus Omnitrophota bacterium]